jgi:hypothetical protein
MEIYGINNGSGLAINPPSQVRTLREAVSVFGLSESDGEKAMV